MSSELTAEAETANPDPTSETPSNPPEGKRILVVDDEPEIARLIQMNLERAGYDVDTANNGAEAFERVRETDYDLLISDVMMPEMDGFTLVKKIRDDMDLRDLPVILLTAKSQNQDVAQGYVNGTDLYLTKPFSPPELMTWVGRLLRDEEGDPDDTGDSAIAPGTYRI